MSSTDTTYSTWPEAAYALSLTKPGTYPAQRSVIELFCAHAFAQGVIYGEAECSERDLAAHLHTSVRSVNAAGELLDGLVKRHVLRLLEKGAGGNPSVWQVWHWTKWDAAWRIREASAFDRATAFAASQIRASDRLNARVLIRATAKVARSISDELSTISSDGRADQDPRDCPSTVFESHQLGGFRSARPPAPPTDSLVRDVSLTLERGSEEQQQRTAELVEALISSGACSYVQGAPLRRVAYLAAESNGRLPELVKLARDPRGPATLMARIEQLEAALRRPASVRKKVTNKPSPAPTTFDPDGSALEGFAKAKQALSRL